MIQQTPQADEFKRQLRDSLQRETLNCAATSSRGMPTSTRVAIMTRWSTSSRADRSNCSCSRPKGKNACWPSIAAGDIFGELCLSGLGARLETATAMEETILKQIPCSQFFARLGRDALFEGFVQYLAVRIADQQQVIANLVTVDSEQRLGKTLLQLARTMGKKDPRSIRIELKISHEELSEMVGTTRPRISLFMQRFHNLGLIETNEDHFLVIKEKKLTAYLAQIA